MTELQERIRSTAKGYFDSELVDSFISTINTIDLRDDPLFFQMRQVGEQPILEFSCYSRNLLIDFTQRPDRFTRSIFPLDSVTGMTFEQSKDQTRLVITIPTSSYVDALTYSAASSRARSELAIYADFIETLLSNRQS